MRLKTKGEYPPDWAAIAIRVKEDAGWRCVRCRHHHDVTTGHMLTVHHLDGDKSNCAWWNLLPLCQRCHLTIQGRVVPERAWLYEHSEWFKPYVAGYYARVHGLDESRTAVMESLDAYLAIGRAAVGRASA